MENKEIEKETETALQENPSAQPMTLQQITRKRKPMSTFALTSLLFGFILLGAFYIYFNLTFVSPINTALKVDNIKVSNQTYDLVMTYMKSENEEITDEAVSIYLSDTIILSEKAKELGLQVEESDYQDLVSKYGDMAERVALRGKLEEYIKEQAVVTEEEMKTFYENAKDYHYIADTHFTFYAVESNKPMPENYQVDTSKMKPQEGTLDLLRAYGIYEPKEGTFQIESEEGTYKYIIIVDGDIEYIPFEQVKDSIREAIYIQKTDGQILDYLESGRLIYSIRYFK